MVLSPITAWHSITRTSFEIFFLGRRLCPPGNNARWELTAWHTRWRPEAAQETISRCRPSRNVFPQALGSPSSLGQDSTPPGVRVGMRRRALRGRHRNQASPANHQPGGTSFVEDLEPPPRRVAWFRRVDRPPSLPPPPWFCLLGARGRCGILVEEPKSGADATAAQSRAAQRSVARVRYAIWGRATASPFEGAKGEGGFSRLRGRALGRPCLSSATTTAEDGGREQ